MANPKTIFSTKSAISHPLNHIGINIKPQLGRLVHGRAYQIVDRQRIEQAVQLCAFGRSAFNGQAFGTASIALWSNTLL
ncbi:hypothetical protein AABM17_2196 [Neisseria musculi]|uniref:Uncharacterized protein n=1 Tax=Neisseria musculi TaxID=1815583 RepID=A0A7H1MF73_9NEIS|nr:hypothetical protein H7A79_2194 [Neisseria musculi]